jgi:hypothetical protein
MYWLNLAMSGLIEIEHAQGVGRALMTSEASRARCARALRSRKLTTPPSAATCGLAAMNLSNYRLAVKLVWCIIAAHYFS